MSRPAYLPSNLTVLVVDDSEPGRYALSHQLRRFGINVIEADCGGKALEMAWLKPSAIFLDVNMPDVNGFEVCRRLKAEPATASIPIIFVTATSADADTVLHARGLGAMSVLFEPVTGEQAALCLAGAVSKSQAALTGRHDHNWATR